MAARTSVDVVLIHGLFSSGEVWRRFEELLLADPELGGSVRLHRFDYPSPRFRSPWRPDQRVPEVDDIAALLRTRLHEELADVERLVLVSHSQGGLVVQRYLARALWHGEARRLARIKHVVLFACPNSGSQFALSLRRKTRWFHRNPQEGQLEPFNRAVLDSQSTVLKGIVHATDNTDRTWRVPIAAYGGLSDNIVPATTVTYLFPKHGVVDGDHFSIVQPQDSRSPSYQAVRRTLTKVLSEEHAPAVTAPEAVVAAPERRRTAVSVRPPHRARSSRMVGRDDLMAGLISDRAHRVHVLSGLGGLGKSRIALELAHRAQEEDHLVFWVEVPRINLAMRTIISGLQHGLGQSGTGVDVTPDALWRLLDALDRPWLLVFDNADDVQRLAPPGVPVAQGSGWLREPRAGGSGRVVVTSRDQNPRTWGAWCGVHQVPRLAPDDGASVLREQVPEGGTSAQARDLSEALGGLPLALHACARYLNSVIKSGSGGPERGVADFVSYHDALSRRFHSSDGQDLALQEVGNVVAMSLKLLGERGLRCASTLLRLLSCLNIAPIPYDALLGRGPLSRFALFSSFSGACDQDYGPTLDGLADLGLVELERVDSSTSAELGRTLTIHPLVHQELRNSPEVRDRRVEHYALCLRLLADVARAHNPDITEHWATWSMIAPHAVDVTRRFLVTGPPQNDRGAVVDALELARLTARYLIASSVVTPAEDLVESLVRGCAEYGFTPEDRELLGLRHERGRIALERGRPEDAEAELRAVIESRTRLLGFDHEDTLASRHKHAKALAEQGQWEEALPLLRDIVDAEHTVRSPEHYDTMVVRHSLARVVAVDDPEEAAGMLREILEIRHRHWAREAPETLSVRRTLATCLIRMGKFDEAVTEAAGALEVAGDQPRAHAVMALRYTLCLALLARDASDQDGLHRQLLALLRDQREVLGEEHPDTARTNRLVAKLSGAGSG
ncbi:alpha/beta fold hydrolase [Actinosynnema pretiosum subsp. pretiosum]|uniref:Alpha/beta fold hydrolase n=1 Tax=Actinosynnema pretiosum subsp. pretiosum TaxID=103721 RepID=A0AA45L9V3_9PSEU|nr:hypothetical protein APASM_2545 [Actinosynnema pretiosum subsp. pretiosum]QUF05892.1 alpha/beta fold hydrolase [Actinosynnema pretiosum subsp. pretiosum]